MQTKSLTPSLDYLISKQITTFKSSPLLSASAWNMFWPLMSISNLSGIQLCPAALSPEHRMLRTGIKRDHKNLQLEIPLIIYPLHIIYLIIKKKIFAEPRESENKKTHMLTFRIPHDVFTGKTFALIQFAWSLYSYSLPSPLLSLYHTSFTDAIHRSAAWYLFMCASTKWVMLWQWGVLSHKDKDQHHPDTSYTTIGISVVLNWISVLWNWAVL